DRPHASFSAMREAGVPCLESVAAVGAALAALRQRGRFLDRSADAPDHAPELQARKPKAVAGSPADYTTEVGSYALLARHGVETPKVLTTDDAGKIAALADTLGYPVVLKAVLPGVAHKSDVGGVRTGLGDAAAVQRAANEMADSVAKALGAQALAGFMVTRDLGRRRELIVGVRRDVSLNTLGIIGLGGVLTEALDDVVVCLLPATPERVERALARLKSACAWGAFRGESAVPAKEVASLLNRLQAALLSDPHIASVECNPVMVIGDQVIPVDAAVAIDNQE
ncbi:MAG TPA: acetate--CoA ligase family protein, partial [Bordetella sp.]|nr:acetate--CoA ligase family protein [Bordetella sp.]